MNEPTTPRNANHPGANALASGIPCHCAFTRLVDVAALVPNPRNPNKHPDKQIALLAKVIRHAGWRAPIVVSRRSGFVVVGHGRLEAAKVLNVEQVPVDDQDFATEADEYAHMIADNRLAELAEIDEAELSKLLRELKDENFDLDLAGFDKEAVETIKGLSDESEVDADPQIDRAAELQAEWKTERGQVWCLGEHRIMCAKSDVSEDVDRLLAADIPSLIWTDPPYGVSYEEKCKHLENYRPQNRASSLVENDAMTPEETESLITRTLTIACPKVAPGCVLYVAAPAGPLHLVFQSAFNNSGFSWHHTLVWVKNHFVMGRSDYHYRHEPILYGWKENGPHYWGSDRTKDTVFEIDKPHDSDLHPTMKPVELVEQMVRNSSRPSDIVYDPFSGSGTTIIACERLGRRCRAMEISPGYTAVALQRFKDATGKEPKLL